MSIKHAVLGLLRDRPMHGYAVRAAFEERLDDFWQLNYGQVYQVLLGLEREGLVVGSDERIGRRPPRKVYGITAKGREELRSWLTRPAPGRRPVRDEFFLRLLVVDQRDGELLAAMLTSELKRRREELAELVERRAAYEAGDRLSAIRVLFAEAAILHGAADVKALELCQQRLPASAGARGAATADDREVKNPARPGARFR